MQMSAGQGSLDEGLRPTWFGRDERLELSQGFDRLLYAVGARSRACRRRGGGFRRSRRCRLRVLLLQRWTGASDQAMARSLRSDLSHLALPVSVWSGGLRTRRRSAASATLWRRRVWRRRCSRRSRCSWRSAGWCSSSARSPIRRSWRRRGGRVPATAPAERQGTS